ncbi:cation channel protein, putative [Bodo saltans]|uniref:Cation channel protein, putative n=1 Tax=Bodo saltans TaxID=75058 RepID=A0A0S4IXP7_BODSA|nr:cation channel protein, putative [Bodo saltans]|eukprot:CUG09277.1 cation channel protein, putative [Bodo saltans]
MHFASAKSLAQTRRNLIEKVRQASGTGVKVFEQSMNSDLQVPSRARGLSFLSALILFIAFIVVLTYELISERSPLDCNQIQTAAMTMFGNYSAVETMPQLLEYLSTSLPTASIQQSRLGNSRRVGSIRIRQIRTVISCPTNSYWNVYSSATTVNSSSAVAFQTPNTPLHTTCSLDITNTDFINRSAIVGRITGVTFPFQDEGQYCKMAFCSMDLPSSILDTVTYSYEGNVMFMHAGVLLDANGTPLVAAATVAPPSSSNNTTSTTTTLQASSSSASPITTTTPEPSSFPSADPSSTTMSTTTTTFQPTTTTITPAPTLPPSTSSSSSDDGSTPSAMATTVVKDLMEDFMQTETRFVQIEATLFHPSSSMATAALLIFECPAAGGVFVTLSVQSVNLFDVNHPRCIFLWAYVVLQILLQLYALVQSLRHSMDCATCSQSSTLIVFKCIKCKSPCELCIGRVSLCGACGTPVPALKHSCWRSIATDIWRIITILSVSSLIVSRIATTLSVTDITNAVGGNELGAPSGQMKQVVSIAAFFSVYRQGISSSIITIICTYIRLFHYVGRGQFGSQFARVLQYSLMPLASFSVNFMVAYSGFCFAFYIAGGPTSVNFSTLSNTFLTSFRFLLSQIGWSELGAVSPGLLALLVLFFIVCFCLMFNIFPSVLSVSYKKAAKTPYYDVDVLSSWLLLKRYVLVPLGIVSGKKKQRRESRQKSRSDSTATSIASDTSDRDDRSSVRSSGKDSDVNVTTAQINALRAGDEIEDVMAQQELKLLNKAADDFSLRMLSQEETLRDAVKQLNRNLQVLSTVLGPLMEDYLSLIEEREAAVGKVGSGTTAVRVLHDRIASTTRNLRGGRQDASAVMLGGEQNSRNLSEVLLMRQESSSDDQQQLVNDDTAATFAQDVDDTVALLQVQSILNANAERLEMIISGRYCLTLPL